MFRGGDIDMPSPSTLRRANPGGRRPARVPWFVRLFNPISKSLLRLGVPMGPDVLLTVRGRKTGLPRSTPVAIAQIAGRWWLMAPFGETDWVLNLRTAGQATIRSARQTEEVTTRELDRAERLTFFRDILDPYLRRNPLARWIVRAVDRLPEDPLTAAEANIIFEVRRAAIAGPGKTVP